MRVLVTGSSGFVGKALVNFLRASGCTVVRLVRREADLAEDSILWDPQNGKIDVAALEGFNTVINLAGENIANRRWTQEQKKKILDSRVEGTRSLVNALCLLKRPPANLLNASAIGIYGDRGVLFCNEETRKGTGFLSEVCENWELAALPAKAKGIRTVYLRFGMILSQYGGALCKMLPIFKWGLGGRLGNGKQWMSWIAIDDVLASILFIMNDRRIQGPVNLVAPYPVTNSTFTKILGNVLHRLAILPVPAIGLKLLLGKELAQELLLSSTRVEPSRLILEGYSFLYPELEMALRNILESD